MPRLFVSQAGEITAFGDGDVVVGRARDCDVTVLSADVSRHHLRLHLEAGRWMLDDTSVNGTFVGGVRTTSWTVPEKPETVALGDPSGTSLMLWQEAEVAGDADDEVTMPPGLFADGATVLGAAPRQAVATVGRGLGNTVVLDDPLVSRVHARITHAPDPVLTDLDSFNGTFVNGIPITGAVPLRTGDHISFGHQTFEWRDEVLVALAAESDFTLRARELTRVTKQGSRLLDAVSFSLSPSSLTAVVGPSGAGKSTLLGALTGLVPADSGHVEWQGQDLYANYDRLRLQIGLVPQQDTLHLQLRVRQALGYSAELRLPPDTTAEERDARVALVAGQLQLGDRLDNRIGTQLSGGQRKRVSIASELLTAPPLLLLDEPTSGLDPGMDLEVMLQLRALADEGHLVVVVTHSVLALNVCDKVIVMAPGGRLAYHGSPQSLLQHFDCQDFPEVFRKLGDGLLPPMPSVPVAGESSPDPDHRTQDAGAVAPPRRSRARQFSTLVRRNVAVVRSDRLLLSLLVLMPVLLGGLSRLVPGDRGLSLEALLQTGALAAGEEARQRITVLVIAATLMGSAIAIRDLVGERAIFGREYSVGLSPSMYFLSKVTVLGAMTFVQGVAVTYLATVGLPGVDDGGSLGVGTLEVALAVGALATTVAATALCVSALVSSVEQTMPALVALVMVELVFSRALVEVAGRPVLDQVSWLVSARWANAAMAASAGTERGVLPGDYVDWFSTGGAQTWLVDMAILLAHFVFFTALGCRLVRRRSARH